MHPEPPLTPASRRQIIRDGLGVGFASGLYATSFGAISVAAGFTVLQTCAMSLLVFTGASQFALVGVVASGGAPLSGAVTALMLGTRNALYGITLAPRLGWRGLRKVAASHLVIDESTAMSVNRPTAEGGRIGFLATGLGVFVFWNTFTLVGALAGTALGDPRDFGLDAAVGGAFLALLWPRFSSPVNRLVGVLAVALAMGLVPLTRPGVPILAAAGVAVVVGLLTRGEQEQAS